MEGNKSVSGEKDETLVNGGVTNCVENGVSVENEKDDNLDEMPPLEDIEGGGDSANENKPNADSSEKEKDENFDENGYCDILDNKQLLKKVLKEGNKDKQRPQRGNKVIIKLTTRLKDSETVIASQSFERLELIVGDYDTIHGVDLIVPLMHEGEVSEIFVSPRFAYGSLGFEPDIPADSTLHCVVELLESEWIDDPPELSIEERIRIGSLKKDRGNFWHSREDYSISGQCYQRAIEFLDVLDEEMKHRDDEESEMANLVRKLIELRTTTYNNLAAVHLKTQSYDAALKAVNSALMLQEKNVKALFRKGKILGHLGEFDEAVDVLRGACKLEPENKAIQTELSRLVVKRREQLANEKVMYKRMLELDEKKPTHSLNAFSWRKWGAVATGVSALVAAVVAYYVNQ